MHYISRSGITLGIGMGGFIDGIVLHQILNWHNMASAVLPPHDMNAMRENMMWDGVFHAAVWCLTFAGIMQLISEAARGVRHDRAHVLGAMLLGWGLFNLVEGIIDHHLLQLHHVRDLPVHEPLYDWSFLLICGLGFVIAGWMLTRRPALISTATRIG